MNYLTVDNLLHLNALQNHEDGEYVYVKETKEIYQWQDGWKQIDIKNEGLTLNLYELNKSIISQMEPLTKEQLWDKSMEVFDFYTSTKDNTHYMLLNKEYNYYTIFEPHYETPEQPEDFADAVLEIVEELGPIYSVDRFVDRIEFWIKPSNSEYDTPIVFILFPYDAGVVYYV